MPGVLIILFPFLMLGAAVACFVVRVRADRTPPAPMTPEQQDAATLSILTAAANNC